MTKRIRYYIDGQPRCTKHYDTTVLLLVLIPMLRCGGAVGIRFTD